MRVLAIDPGKQHLGWAYMLDNQLTWCGVSKLPREAAVWTLGQVCRYHFGGLCAHGLPETDRVIVERMSLNKARDATLAKVIATGNDLLQLQAIGAFIAGRMGGSLEYVTHHAAPKEVTKNQVLHALSAREMDTLNEVLPSLGRKTDDLFDAVRHGLRAVGR